MVPRYLAAIPTSRTEIKQSLLNIENKQRSNLFAWNGQFSPQLVEVLLKKYAPRSGTILDPFAGSGTVLHECGREHLSGVAGEINPSAFSMARLYGLINVPQTQRADHLAAVEEALHPFFLADLELWRGEEQTPRAEVSDLLRLREGLSRWPVALIEALIVMADPAMKASSSIRSTWQRLKSTVQELPFSDAPLVTFNCDARQLPIPDSSVDLVVTSPPYINVFNYHQQYRIPAEALGWDLLTVAKSEIGSNRKHRGNRFLTVIQYCLDITAVLSELSRVCKPSARAIFVVGRESTVRGSRFFNGEIVGRLAAECTSFRLDFRQERAFTNRFGHTIVEDLLHFHCRKTHKHSDLFSVSDARTVAESFLRNAVDEAQGDEVRTDIESAIALLTEVQPSPFFCSVAAQRGAR